MSLVIKLIKSVFGKDRPLTPTIKSWVYEEGGGWGNRIEVNWEKRRITGWKPRKPRSGDIFVLDMQSGKQAVFTISDVEYVHDPFDMFFASLVDIGYVCDQKDWLQNLVKNKPNNRTTFIL